MSFLSIVSWPFRKIAQGFLKLFGKEGAHALGEAAKLLLKSALGVISADAVAFVETLHLSDSNEKRRIAFGKIVTDATAQGLHFTDSAINLLIEIAVAAIKNQQQTAE